MVIITNDSSAVMFYSESQWLDAQYVTFDSGLRAFRIPGAAGYALTNILGSPAFDEITEIETDYNPETDEVTSTTVVTQAAVEAVPAMTLADVIAASSEELTITTA